MIFFTKNPNINIFFGVGVIGGRGVVWLGKVNFFIKNSNLKKKFF